MLAVTSIAAISAANSLSRSAPLWLRFGVPMTSASAMSLRRWAFCSLRARRRMRATPMYFFFGSSSFFTSTGVEVVLVLVGVGALFSLSSFSILVTAANSVDSEAGAAISFSSFLAVLADGTNSATSSLSFLATLLSTATLISAAALFASTASSFLISVFSSSFASSSAGAAIVLPSGSSFGLLLYRRLLMAAMRRAPLLPEGASLPSSAIAALSTVGVASAVGATTGAVEAASLAVGVLAILLLGTNPFTTSKRSAPRARMRCRRASAF
mmetsp:Transcript_13825/g.30089  ORF Transcript_13825/g.30089 Transcript_13825/m.30089 type:complete len:270 (+) Transcript_13825:1334-2143(+)